MKGMCLNCPVWQLGGLGAMYEQGYALIVDNHTLF